MMPADQPIELPSVGREGELWSALLELSHALPAGWTLVGGLMVFLHAYEAGLNPQRATLDVDALVDVRAVTGAARNLSAVLLDLGWDLPEGNLKGDDIGFRFVRGPLRLDVLAPDGLGPRTDITTIPPVRAMPVAGGSRALARSSTVAVVLSGHAGKIPRPDLLGALVIKSRAARLDRGVDGERRPERHREDLALLYAAIADPFELSQQLLAADRRHLRSAPEPSWWCLASDARAAQERAAREILIG